MATALESVDVYTDSIVCAVDAIANHGYDVRKWPGSICAALEKPMCAVEVGLLFRYGKGSDFFFLDRRGSRTCSEQADTHDLSLLERLAETALIQMRSAPGWAHSRLMVSVVIEPGKEARAACVPISCDEFLGAILAMPVEHGRDLTNAEQGWLECLGTLLGLVIVPGGVQHRLEKSELRYSALVRSLPQGVLELSGTGRIVSASARAAEMLGYSTEELAGIRLSELAFDGVGGRELASFCDRAEAGRSSAAVQLRIRDHGPLWASFTMLPLATAVSAHDGPLVLITDLTEQRAFDSELSHGQRLESLGLLASGVAHDFNNLLVGILGNVAMARERLAPTAPIAPLLADAERAAHRAAALANQMLAYSAKNQGHVQACDVNRIVREMTQLLAAVISKTARLEFDLDPKLPAVWGEPTQLQQVVMNLITNASDAVGSGQGTISVATRVGRAERAYLDAAHLGSTVPEGDYVFVEVADTGSGMSPETLRRIFDPFFTTKLTGRGLGLAASLGILRRHGGAVTVESELGRGTKFRVLLPASENIQRKPSSAPAPAIQTGLRGSILVADDEALVREVTKRVLEQAGFAVVTAADGREALSLLRSRPAEFAACLLDLTMPGLSGLDAFRELRRIRPDLKVVTTSGYGEGEITQELRSMGMAAFIRKPWQPAALVELLRQVVERPRSWG